MSMDPQKVLLEASFLAAVSDPLHARHDECVAEYRDLVGRFEREEALLVAVGDHLRDADLGTRPAALERVRWFLHRPRRGVFAPVDPLYVGFQHRRAAARTRADDPVVALTLVMCSRHKIRHIATVDPAYEEFDLAMTPIGAI